MEILWEAQFSEATESWFMRVLFAHPQACYLKRIVQFWQNCFERETCPPVTECLVFSQSIAFLFMQGTGWGCGKCAKWWSELDSRSSSGELTSAWAAPARGWPCLPTHPGQVSHHCLAGSTDGNIRVCAQPSFHKSHLFASMWIHFCFNL